MSEIETGIIFKSEIKKNLDADKATQMFQIELAEKGDAENIEELHIPGIQYKPAENSRGFVSRVTNAWKILLGIDDFIPKETLAPGERLFYSDDGSVIKARILLKADGKIQIGDGTEEVLDLIDQELTELIKLVGSTMLDGTVDAPGVASTGTLSVISVLLSAMKTSFETIQTKLSTLKI